MSEIKLQAIVLAAGKSTRFNTGKTKLLEKICGQEMILYTTKLLEKMDIHTTLVIGHQADLVKEVVTAHHGESINFVYQKEQRGTGHAIVCARNNWEEENILIINGDSPLVSQKIIEELQQKHQTSNAVVSFVTAHNADPSSGGYGRVIQSDNGMEIVEAKEFKGDPSEHCCINAGIYIVQKNFLTENIDAIQNNGTAKEFYFTDLIKLASDQGLTITTTTASFDCIRGINTFQELWAAEHIKRSELIKYWMDQGVRFSIVQTVHIDIDVTIGAGSYIGCGTHVLRGSKIGRNCTINEFSSVENSVLEDDVTIESHTLIKDSHIGSNATIGPFAHLRDNTIIGQGAVIGNFVEIKKSIIGKDSKAKHLSYLGDATIGSKVNIGAGTITCNHNGFTKHTTTIKDHAYIGSNTTLIAPVTVNKGAFTAAGSVITDDVPENALAFGRARQVNKEGYAETLRKKNNSLKKNEKNEENNNNYIAAIKTGNETTTTENS